MGLLYVFGKQLFACAVGYYRLKQAPFSINWKINFNSDLACRRRSKKI
jgi:hypothetical protein